MKKSMLKKIFLITFLSFCLVVVIFAIAFAINILSNPLEGRPIFDFFFNLTIVFLIVLASLIFINQSFKSPFVKKICEVLKYIVLAFNITSLLGVMITSYQNNINFWITFVIPNLLLIIAIITSIVYPLFTKTKKNHL